MSETILRNGRLVLPDEVVTGDIVIRDGRIASIEDPGTGRSGIDLEGDWLVPGLVELHTDHLEGHFAPRPKVRWNPTAALQAHDAQIATSGITTVFDALRVGMDDDTKLTSEDMAALGEAIGAAHASGRLRAEHFIHLRCEVSAPDVMESFEHFRNEERVRLASLMDHTPGQRQFTSLDAFRAYYGGKTGMNDGELQKLIEQRTASAALYSDKHRVALAEICRDRGIFLASHDDATPAHVAEAISLGVGLAEFPTTMEAAEASHGAGLKVLMGAPNIVRGGSHSGNIAAHELARRGLLDVLSSDYFPFSLLHAAFKIAEEGPLGLPEAFALVSRNPADTVGLDDRGAIVPGRRADLVHVRAAPGEIPIIRAVWREGQRVV